MSRIIVGVDESTGAAGALRWAVREGRHRDWPVIAVMAWGLLDQHHPGAPDAFDPAYDDTAATAILNQAVIAAVGKDTAASVEQHTVCDLPAPALIGYTQTDDLLVVGARGLGGFKTLLLGSVSTHCLHHARAPTVIVRGPAADHPPHIPEHITVGVDGSPHSQTALRWALDTARHRHADVEIEVVHAWQPPPITGPFNAGIDATGIEAAARETLDSLIDRENTDHLTIRRSLSCGSAAAALIDASYHSDLLIVGCRGLGGFKSLLLGSTSNQLAHHAACPLLVTRNAEAGT